MISDHVAPRLVPDTEILPSRLNQALAVEVHPNPTRPHYFNDEGQDRGVYVRLGSTDRRGDRELVEELRRFTQGQAFDEQPMSGLDSEALDFRAASESFTPLLKLRRRDLETLRLVTAHQGRRVPTIDGIRQFGIRANRGGDPFTEKHAQRGTKIETVRCKECWNLPRAAVREAVMSVVAHTDYVQRDALIRVSISTTGSRRRTRWYWLTSATSSSERPHTAEERRETREQPQ